MQETQSQKYIKTKKIKKKKKKKKKKEEERSSTDPLTDQNN